MGNETWHLCSSRILFDTFVLKAPLGPFLIESQTGAAMAYRMIQLREEVLANQRQENLHFEHLKKLSPDNKMNMVNE